LTLSRLLVAVFGPACRFEPSCSRYAVACLEGHGALRGTLLSVRRLCKCHPFHPGGYDPPPPPRPTPRPGGADSPGPSVLDQKNDRTAQGAALPGPTPDFSQTTRPETAA